MSSGMCVVLLFVAWFFFDIFCGIERAERDEQDEKDQQEREARWAKEMEAREVES